MPKKKAVKEEVELFDVSELFTVDSSTEGRVCKILNPKNRKETGFNITLYGCDSKEYMEAKSRMSKKIAEAGKDLTEHQRIQFICEMLAEVTISWVGAKVAGKDNLPCSEANAIYVYYNAPLIRNQVDTFTVSRENFL